MLDSAIALLLFIMLFSTKFGGKIANTSQYKNGELSVVGMAIALFATTVGGWSTMGFAQYTFEYGAVMFLIPLALFCRDMIEGFTLSHFFWRFRNCKSVGDVVSHYYGRDGKIAAGIAGAFQCSIMVGLQASALGYLAKHFFRIEHWQGMIASFVLILAHYYFIERKPRSLLGILKLAMLVVALPNLFIEASHEVGGVFGLMEGVPKEHFSLMPDSQFTSRIYSLAIILALSIFSPAMVQRMLRSKDAEKVKKALFVTMIMRAHYGFMIGIIALAALIMFPSAEPVQALPMLFERLLPNGVRGVFLVGIVAIIMASAEGHLDALKDLLRRDILRPLFRRKLNDQRESFYTRNLLFLLALFGLIVAIFTKDIFELGLFAWSFWLPVIVVPLVFAMLGLRGNLYSFWSSGFIGMVFLFLWNFKFFEKTNIYGLLPATFLSATIFLLINIFGNDPKAFKPFQHRDSVESS